MAHLEFSQATVVDLVSIIALLADDPLGNQREKFEQPLPISYQQAFRQINDNPSSQLIVGKDQQKVIAVAQIDFITYLTYQGGKRAQIEGVRVDKHYRQQGVGKQLFDYIIALAKSAGCHMVQLTSNSQRPQAQAFYQQLGFVASHTGFKLKLKDSATGDDAHAL